MNLQEAKAKLETLPGVDAVKIRVLHDVSIDIYINEEPEPLADGELPLDVIADFHCAQHILLSSETIRQIWAIVDAAERTVRRRLSAKLAQHDPS